jgi:hypothetical protein
MELPKRRPKRKLLKLNEQAFNQVETNATEIASALCEATKKGNCISARLLVELAQDQIDTEEASRKQVVQSIGKQIELEKEWIAPPLTPEEEALATGVPLL